MTDLGGGGGLQANLGVVRGARTHELKSWPEYFKPVQDGRKTFELRRDDRDFAVGDVLLMREWDPERKEYTGNEIRRSVTYVLRGFYGPDADLFHGPDAPLRGLTRGYCILGLTPA
jgi:hypothetical protein